MNWKPNKWIGAVLAFLFAPLGFLYVNKLRLAGAYFVILLGLSVLQVWLTAIGTTRTPFALIVQVIAAIHAYSIARQAPGIAARPWFSRWYSLITIMLTPIIGVISFRAFIFDIYRIPANSMFPSIPRGSYVIVQKYGYGNYGSYGIHLFKTHLSAPLNRGDVLVFEYPRERRTAYLKRLIGLPGDHIEYRNRRLYVNGAPVPTYAIQSTVAFEIDREASYQVANRHNSPPYNFDVTVKPGHLFFLGDNRDNSNDSRFFGQVPYDYVIGKVVLVMKNDDMEYFAGVNSG